MENDSWESGGKYGPGLYGPDSTELAATLQFRYVDSNAQLTSRVVNLRSFSTDGVDGAILGHCQLRNANRTFLISRMTNVVHVETGGEIRHLSQWLQEQYAASPRGMAQAFLDQHGPAIALLAAMAKADGSVRAKERVRMAMWCVTQGASPAVAAHAVKEVRAWLTPSAKRIGIYLRALQQMPPAYQATVLTAMEDIVGTDKTLRDTETRLLARAKRELKDAGAV